jgi:Helix-turn-helix domain
MDALIEKQGLSVSEASHIAGIGRTKLYEAIGAGQLAVRKFGKRTIVLREDLTYFLATLPVTNPEVKPRAQAGRSLKLSQTASVTHSGTVVEQLPTVASKSQPKKVRYRARRLHASDRSR